MAETLLPPHVREREYWKQYRAMRTMTARLASQRDLVRRIREEPAIPAQAQDAAAKALSVDIEETRHLFGEVLETLITTGMQTSHSLDIETVAAIPADSDLIEVLECLLWVDGEEERIEPEIGGALIRYGIRQGHGAPVRALLAFYRTEEVRYDRRLEGSLERCSLTILQEVYPAKQYHIRMRLPAEALIGRGILS
ncbi:hypothetical protein ABH15_08435 [Methanoculleus taiwanensis]|uniref:Uncharacterized protein n=1 Tax=Methanoculleus taiwanensis TaxID=1550565 RepID=A0A498H2I7_9EURY|nr:hypothetical protein [Methanoculleus taiwanensis]RXE56176.1 hypothetical protein ABH15_08435 [Methanoculleus taiwanensis]